MISTIKKSIFFICITYLLSACTTEFSKDINGSFNILGAEIENRTIFLIDEIDMKISADRKVLVEISNNKKIEIQKSVYDSVSIYKVNRYHKLTQAYGKFLSEIEKEFINNDKNPLFQSNEITRKGQEYIGRTNLYTQEIKKLWVNDLTMNKVSTILNTDYIQNSEGAKISHVAYYFNDLPTKGIIVYLKQKKYNILSLENDFLNDLIFQNLTASINSKK
ncbi:hypothetical protein [uncultured Kordia sp.]|uniref:hypothetical protein n=1 Tax=uncultured Kordia sp. TaxID=507699 RepID=UPI00261DD50A|nr:hypothetical protein [uncultured Kordia sp.]